MSRSHVRALNRLVVRGNPGNQAAALAALLDRSISFGHRRLAIRRYRMLLACGHEVSGQVKAHCEALIAACASDEPIRVR